jgi:hypothetical protein
MPHGCQKTRDVHEPRRIASADIPGDFRGLGTDQRRQAIILRLGGVVLLVCKCRRNLPGPDADLDHLVGEPWVAAVMAFGSIDKCRTAMNVEHHLSHVGGIGMVEGWTVTIDVAVTEGYVSYVATGDDPDAHGVAEISGNASLLHLSDAEPSKFQISLAILGKSASQAKSEADQDKRPWPDVMNEITDNDDVIGILFKTGVKEFELRRSYLYLHPAQFDKLMGNLTTGTEIRFYTRQGVQSECDLIVKADVTRKFEPQS